MGKTESFVYFRVVVLFHNLNTKQSQLILAVWNWMDMRKRGCYSPSQPKHKNSLSCCELFLAVWNRMDVEISKNKTVTVVIN